MQELHVKSLLPVRLDKYLMEQFPALGLGRLNKALRENKIKLNGKKQPLATRVQNGDVIRVYLLDDQLGLTSQEGPEFLQARAPAEFIYENDDLIVANKPAGIPVDGDESATLLNRVLRRLYEEKRWDVAHEPRLCHRLDTGTSGLVLCAQNAFAAPELAKTAQKCYLALVEGPLPVGSGRIDVPIARRGDSIIGRCVREDGKPSVTEYTVLAASASHALVSCFPVTGRTHQIRVHFSWLGHPLAGDSLYGGHTDIIARHALHCAVLRFNRPADHEPRRVQSPLPEDFLAACCAAYLPDKEEIQTMLQSVLPCAE